MQAVQPGLFAPLAVGEPLLAIANQRLQAWGMRLEIVERTPTGIVRGIELILPDNSALQFNASEIQRTRLHPFPGTALVWQLMQD